MVLEHKLNYIEKLVLRMAKNGWCKIQAFVTTNFMINAIYSIRS